MSHSKGRSHLTGLRSGLAALSNNARLLLSITVFNSFALSAVGALLNPYLRNAGMSASFVGVYFSVAALSQGIAAFAGGFLADSWGRRRVWMIGKVLQVCAYLWLASGVTGPAILVAAVLAGLSQMSLGAVSAMQADASDPKWRATFFGVIQTVQSLMGAVAPLAGGLLADRYGARWAFAGVLPLLLLVALMIRQLAENPRAGQTQPQLSKPIRSVPRLAMVMAGMRGRLADLTKGIVQGPYPRTATALLVFNILNGIGNGAVGIVLPMLMRDRLGMGYTGISGINTAAALGTALTVVLGARVADRHGRRRVILASIASGALLTYGLPYITTALGFYMLIFAFGLVANAANGAFGATAMEAVRDDVRASYGGVMSGLNAGGMAVGSLVGGFAYAANPNMPLYILMGLMTGSAVLLYFFLQETGLSAHGQQPAAPAAAAIAAENS